MTVHRLADYTDSDTELRAQREEYATTMELQAWLRERRSERLTPRPRWLGLAHHISDRMLATSLAIVLTIVVCIAYGPIVIETLLGWLP